MKNIGQPIRDSLPWYSWCTKDPRWLNNVFLFSTEIWAEQLEKPPAYFIAEQVLISGLPIKWQLYCWRVPPLKPCQQCQHSKQCKQCQLCKQQIARCYLNLWWHFYFLILDIFIIQFRSLPLCRRVDQYRWTIRTPNTAVSFFHQGSWGI